MRLHAALIFGVLVLLGPSLSLADIAYRCKPTEATKQVSDLGLKTEDIDQQNNHVLVRSEAALPPLAGGNANFIAMYFVGENAIAIRAPEQNSILQMSNGSFAKLRCTPNNSVPVNTATVD